MTSTDIYKLIINF